MLEKIAAAVALLLAVLSIAAAFESFTNVDLVWKLPVTALAALLVSLSLAYWLAQWCKPAAAYSGYWHTSALSPEIRRGLSAIALGAVCVVFVAVALLQIKWFALQFDHRTAPEKSTARLIASSLRVESVTIPLPPGSASNCKWANEGPPSVPNLKMQMIDWDSPVRKLHIDDFVYPQRLSIECAPGLPISNISVVPPTVTIYHEEELSRWKWASYLLGGLLWLAGCGLLWHWSR
jgi:hypothetical protein